MPLPRLKKRAEFLAAAASRHFVRTPTMLVQCRPHQDNSEISLTRVGFTASRRVGSAVIRNRAKRRLRALVDTLIPKLSLAFSSDIVLIATPSTASAPFSQLKNHFILALKKLALIKDTSI